MAVTHFSQQQRAKRIDNQIRQGAPKVNSLEIPQGKTEKQTAKVCDDRLRHLANHSVERGLLMFIMKSPSKTGRPMFQYVEGMTEQSTFADYVQSIHGLSRRQATYDIQTAIVWAGVQGITDVSLDNVGKIFPTSPPPESHIREIARIARFKTDKVPDALGKNTTIPVGVENPKMIKAAWSYVTKKHEQAVKEAEKIAKKDPDDPKAKPPKLNTTFIRNRLSDSSPSPNQCCFYTQAGVEPFVKKPTGRIAKLCGTAVDLFSILLRYEEYENGIEDVAAEDGWNKTQRGRVCDYLRTCRDKIDAALDVLD